jgi:hypothetical protein
MAARIGLGSAIVPTAEANAKLPNTKNRTMPAVLTARPRLSSALAP